MFGPTHTKKTNMEAAIEQLTEKMKVVYDTKMEIIEKETNAHLDRITRENTTKMEELAKENAMLKDSLKELFDGLRENLSHKEKDKKRMPPPQFKGKQGEDPNTHLLVAEDWLLNEGFATQPEMAQNFRYTLQGTAREWYKETESEIHDWDGCKAQFTKQFSKHGRTDKQLFQKWKNLSFDPNTDNIGTFLKEVKQTAEQLKYSDESVVTCIKSCMPENVQISLYNLRKSEEITPILLDIYATGPPPSSQPTTSLMRMTPTDKQVSFQDSTVLKDCVERQTESLKDLTLAVHEMKQAPFKPYMAPRGRGFRGGRGYSRGRGRGRSPGRSPYRGYRGRSSFRGTRGSFRGNRGRGNFSRNRSADRNRCYNCYEMGHWARECPNRSRDNFRGRSRDSSEGNDRQERYRSQSRERQNRYPSQDRGRSDRRDQNRPEEREYRRDRSPSESVQNSYYYTSSYQYEDTEDESDSQYNLNI